MDKNNKYELRIRTLEAQMREAIRTQQILITAVQQLDGLHEYPITNVRTIKDINK